MKIMIASAMTLGLMTSAAMAAEPAKTSDAQKGPIELTAVQMDEVTAGRLFPGNQVAVGNLVNAQVQDVVVLRNVDVCAICTNPDLSGP
jgi:hypothetical protein